MGYEYHWVVIYDTDLGAFKVDVETTIMNLAEHPGLVYNKSSERWEDLEEGSGLEAEYARLEDALTLQLTQQAPK